ncbi:MAG: murein biosynthesis integral membrane protein MurJ [Parcubacteria group bacterium CG1_02_37_51]|nr:MAG: murein biosynthesis integral membrane protein MurJ [Parcubacteria group bacterium CG1_02_37_51]
MLKKFWQKILTSVTGGAVLIAFFSIISKIIGLLRDRILASEFGADIILDVYYASFRLPDMIFNTLVLGAFSAAFIPVFVKLWDINKDRAYELINIIISKLVLSLILISFGAILLAPLIVKLIAPGFSGETQQMTINLTRIMLISIGFFSFSNVMSGVLNSWKVFLPYAIAPIFYNLGIIFGIVALYPLVGVNGLGYGVILGAILHMLIQVPSVYKRGWRFKLIYRKTIEVRRIIKLMLPRTIGLAANQINQLVITSIASTLTVGSIAIFNLANNLQSFPISIFGLSLAIAAFPVFSKAWAQAKPEDFRGCFSITFRKILFFIIPISLLLLVMRAQVVRVILGSGGFDWEDTYYTAQMLGAFTLSLFAQGTIPLLARSFYSHEDTRTPVIIGIISVLVNLVLSFILSRNYGIVGLGLAFSIANIINMLLLLIVLRERVGDLDDKNIIRSIFKVTINSVIAGVASYGLLHGMAFLVNMQTFFGILLQATVAGIGGLTIYFIMSSLTHMPEIAIIRSFYRQYLKGMFTRKA